MILYFADRKMNIIGQASTTLPQGLCIVDDSKVDDVESGVASFEFVMPFDDKTRSHCESCVAVGNYILLNRNGKDEFYTIIESETDTKNQEITVYAEDAGLDLLNEIVGAYEADKAYNIAHYINKYTYDSGFVIGINEVSKLTRKLKWDGEDTAAARLASIATQFDGCEISFSFTIERMTVTEKKINIHKKRGADHGVTLWLNRDIDRIVTKQSIANLATALEVVGGTPEDTNTEDDKEPVPITLKGYKYDDGDFHVSGTKLMSRKALKKWSRYIWADEPNQVADVGHIVRLYSYDTTSQQELCAHALTELKKLCEIEVNYEIDIAKLPDNVRLGDRITIVDESGELYLSTRILKIEESEYDQTHKATLGEYLLKGSGISQKVADLASQFAQMAASSSRALSIANNAKTAANAAQEQANAALNGVQGAVDAAQTATNAANNATQAAQAATQAASDAQAAVDTVEKSIESLETTVGNAQDAAAQAAQAAATAQTKATEAHTASVTAGEKADVAKAAAENAQAKADQATTNATAAKSAADEAKQYATNASNTAAAAKLDAEQAKKDIADFGENLETVKDTMNADFSRKTDLTEATANLQSQITRNAAVISSTVSMMTVIDETANDAATQAEKAQARAQAAQEEADKALQDAIAARSEAYDAEQAANAAQAEADTAQAAADTAKRVADQAQAALDAAKADLESVQSRADATEEEIAQAQAAVNTAQAQADQAQADATAAVLAANNALVVANTAVNNATTARAQADAAASYAKIAQSVANEATNASEAQNTANDAAQAAAEAQRTATDATTKANEAKTAADNAAKNAAQAVKDAEAADQQAAQAADNLVAAKQRLAEVLANVNHTQAEVDAAQADVETAQQAANVAMEKATVAAAHAAQAKINAVDAQKSADDAQAQADAAQQAATEAQEAADKAQNDVDSLTVVVSSAESTIQQLADSLIALVRNGETKDGSLVRVDENGLWYFDISGLQDSISNTANNLSSLEGIVLDANGKIDVLKSTAAALQERTEYVRSYTDENGQPCLELGEGDSILKMRITNTEIQFAEGTDVPAKINRKMLVIEKAMVKSELQFGDDEAEGVEGVWVWKRRANGNLGLSWKGVGN